MLKIWKRNRIIFFYNDKNIHVWNASKRNNTLIYGGIYMNLLPYYSVILLMILTGCLKDNPTVEELQKDKKLMQRVKTECFQMDKDTRTQEVKCTNLDIAIEEALKESPM